MDRLHHFWLCPFSRKVRVVLNEKRRAFDLVHEPFWQRRQAFLDLNPAGEVPVLLTGQEARTIADSGAICEYLDEVAPTPPLIGADPYERAHVRALVAWFDLKFHREVTAPLVGEKVNRRLARRGQPDSTAIRAGYANIGFHLTIIADLAERRNWLAGNAFSLADIAAAAQISCVDYLGDIDWQAHAGAKYWYARIKSRPSFRSLLADHVGGIPPARHYADLDF